MVIINKILFSNFIYKDNPCEMLVENGLVTQINSLNINNNIETERIDCEGMCLLPSFVDAHSHLDKTIMGLGKFEHNSPDFLSILRNERAMRRTLGLDTFKQACRYIELIVPLGTLHMRSHVDIDTENGLSGLEGVLKAKEHYKDLFNVQLVAFPQSGLIVRPGTYELLDEALALGADVVGGLDPSTVDKDAKASIDAVFSLAQKHGKPIDIHLHEPDEIGALSIELIAERTVALGMQGQVTISHAFCLSSQNQVLVNSLLEKLSNAKISIATSSSAAHTPLAVQLLLAGVNICAGNDNVNDIWNPYGTGDILERMRYVVNRNGFKHDFEMQLAVDICTKNGANMIGIKEYGLNIGCNADFVLVPAKNIHDAILLLPQKRTVVRHGRIVAQNGQLCK